MKEEDIKKEEDSKDSNIKVGDDKELDIKENTQKKRPKKN